MGKVYLIGAGPGDPGLLTIKGKHIIRSADVIVYDYLAPKELLAYAKPDAERIYVGKKGGDHTLSQENINAMLVEKAQSGRVVARLKGGDPYIFGRGGEEAEILKAHGIPFEVVPGVTSAIAAAAYAGIPLTHRQFTSTISFITGHEDPNKSGSAIHWQALAQLGGTMVFLMGVKNLSHIVQSLLTHGKSIETPVALIQWGTTPRQKTAVGTLGTIVDRVREIGIFPPAIIVVGEVISLRNVLNWYEEEPLFGKTIVITRAREQASDLVHCLTELGANCIETPTIEIQPYQDGRPLASAIQKLDVYDWLLFTSVNGVNAFFSQLSAQGKDARSLARMQTACIGPATSQALLNHGIRTDLMPDSYRAESVVSAFQTIPVRGKKMLLPRALSARPVLPIELEKMGAVVDEVPAYCTTQGTGSDPKILHRLLTSGSVDLVTFTSSSTAENFKALLKDTPIDEYMSGIPVASIGPVTTETATRLGFHVRVTAEQYTIPGLVDAIRHYFETAQPLG